MKNLKTILASFSILILLLLFFYKIRQESLMNKIEYKPVVVDTVKEGLLQEQKRLEKPQETGIPISTTSGDFIKPYGFE